jgi:small basic protein (TIGR04137 family)
MTIDKSLKVRRGVTRAERLERLKENERWSEGMSPIGLPKVRVKKLSLKKKKKTKKEEDEAAPAKGGAKAAPAKGGKK